MSSSGATIEDSSLEKQERGMYRETDLLIKKDTSDTITSSSSSNSNNSNEVDVCHSIWADVQDIIVLGIPLFLSMLSGIGMRVTDSAILGHVSSRALSAAALADLSTMCTGVFAQPRVLSILAGAAFGAGNPHLAGIYMQVAFVVLGTVTIVVMVTWYFTERIWLLLGSDPDVAKMAGYYAEVLAWSLPGLVLFQQLSQFLSSQRIMYPEVSASAAAVIVNLFAGLVLVLGVGVPGWDGLGFPACPIITTFTVYVSLFMFWFIVIFWQRLHESAWTGWDWKEITAERIRRFIDLYVPASMGSASDFWRMAIIGGISAQLGELEVAVFHSAYRIMWMVSIAATAIASASAIKMTLRLGKGNHVGAKQAGELGIVVSALTLVLLGFFVYWKIRWFGRIFSNDPDLLGLFEAVRLPFALTLVFMNLAVAIERIPYAMGRTQEVFWYGFVASWGVQVPAVALLVRYWNHDLTSVYWGMTAGYFALTVLYAWMTFTSDWKEYAKTARDRSEMPKE